VLAETHLFMFALTEVVVIVLHYRPVGWGWGFFGFGTEPSGAMSRPGLVWGKLFAIENVLWKWG
jgi:hypothetical protein